MLTEFTIPLVPSLVNASRGKHRMAQAQSTADWRQAAYLTAVRSRVFFVTPVGITVYHTTGNRSGRMPDPGACFLSSKAAIDGFVDAGVLIEDSPRYVYWVKFMAPVRGADHSLRFVFEAV